VSRARLKTAALGAGALSAILALTLSGCAAIMPQSARGEATAIRIACAYWQAHVQAGTCGFTSVSLNGGVWYVSEPMSCPQEMSCVGGGSEILISKATGRVIKIFVGE
jgi:hypothetical protein